jgi:hypothetical protein
MLKKIKQKLINIIYLIWREEEINIYIYKTLDIFYVKTFILFNSMEIKKFFYKKDTDKDYILKIKNSPNSKIKFHYDCE